VQVDLETLAQANVKAALLTSRKGRIDERCDRELFQLIRYTRVPLLGLAGGHIPMAQAYHAKLTPMRDLKPGEKDPYPGLAPGRLKEWGMTRVRVVRRDPLFEGMADAFTVEQHHSWHVANLPDDLILIASTRESPVQAFKHRTRLVYGVQFFPQRYDDTHPDGRVILRNFLRLAGAE